MRRFAFFFSAAFLTVSLSAQEQVWTYKLLSTVGAAVENPGLYREQGPPSDAQDLFRNPDRFTISRHAVPTLGFTTDYVWLRFDLWNTSNQKEWFLELGYTPVDSARLYELEGGTLEEIALGTDRVFTERFIDYRHLLFPLELETGEKKSYLLRIHTTTSVNVPLTVWPPDLFKTHLTTEGLLLGLFYGMMVVMFLYNVFLYISVKDRSYLYYLLWLIGATAVQLSLNGYGFQFFWPYSPWWNKVSVAFFMAFGGAAGLLFARAFLSLEGRKGWERILLWSLTIACGAGMVLPFLAFYSVSIRFITVVWVILPPFMVWTAVRRLMEGYLPARFFLLAWTATFVGTLIFALKSLAVLPANVVTTWAMQVGIALEVILISLALADRINRMELERQRAQESAISTKNKLLDSFSRFVPTQFLLFLKRDSVESVDLGDAVKQEMTILFSDIRRFTSLAETMSADDSFRFLNSYFRRMEPVIQDSGGFVDKYIGDAIMALFPGMPFQAVEAAMGMRKVLAELNGARARAGRPAVNMGIGIHTGELMLGTVGSNNRMETTVIGDSVNLCNRLEGLTKRYGVPVLISEPVFAALPDELRETVREIDRVRVKGKDSLVRVYDVFGAEPSDVVDRRKRNMERFSQAVLLYRSGDYEEASGLLEDALKQDPEDPVLAYYQERVAQALMGCLDTDEVEG